MKKIPRQKIFEVLSALKGNVGLYVQSLDSGETFAVNAEQVFVSASVIKIPLLALALRDVQQGRLDWNIPREIAPRNRVSGTGILCELSKDYHPSLSFQV